MNILTLTSPVPSAFSMLTKDDKGKVSKTTIFSGVATSEKKEVITIAHFGDTPLQTYLVKE